LEIDNNIIISQNKKSTAETELIRGRKTEENHQIFIIQQNTSDITPELLLKLGKDFNMKYTPVPMIVRAS
jgi:hypothetical protein